MKIAIVGAGISGLSCAYYLSRNHDVTVFESAPQVGGHTATKVVEVHGETHAIDTGFIVYNDWTYPNFIKLLNELGVTGRPSEMSFSVSCEQSGLEYAGSNLNTLFADRRNLLRPGYWKMLSDIMRFNREAIDDLESDRLPPELLLGEYLKSKNFGRPFIDKYLVPMGAAIWSSTTDAMEEFSALFFIRFFKNHGLLSVKNRPQWYTIVGGSNQYIEPLTNPYSDSVLTDTIIHRIDRSDGQVNISYSTSGGSRQNTTADALVVATHSDQAIELLHDISPLELELLAAIPYRANEVVLHTDVTRLPQRPLAWSSWNYRLSADTDNLSDDSLATDPLAKLTYNMNILQGLTTDTVFCVSLNQSEEIDEHKILGSYEYSHPVFTAAGVKAQGRWQEIAGTHNTWFCGAYWGSGFHEDGIVSALRVVDSVNQFSKRDGAAVA